MNADSIERLRGLAHAVSGINQGLGAIVPKAMADDLRRLGIHEGYTAAREMPISSDAAYGCPMNDKTPPEISHMSDNYTESNGS